MNQLLTFLPILMIYAGCAGDPPKVNTGNASPPPQKREVPVFSGKNAFEHLTKQVSFGPRNPGSRGHSACLDFLTSELRGLASSVETQPFPHLGYEGERLNLTNIIARFQPELPSRVLLCAHWDTRPRADQDENQSRQEEPIPGANDGASGVAVLLELARIFKEHPPAMGVDIVFFDGEDYGKEGDVPRYLLGSKHFALNLPAGHPYRFGLLLDMVGDKHLELPQEQYSLKYAGDIVSLVWGKARELGYLQFIQMPGEAVIDDHLPLNEVGIKTIDIIDFDYPDPTNRFWHTHQDTPENCSPESLEAVGTVLTHVLYTLSP